MIMMTMRMAVNLIEGDQSVSNENNYQDTNDNDDNDDDISPH